MFPHLSRAIFSHVSHTIFGFAFSEPAELRSIFSIVRMSGENLQDLDLSDNPLEVGGAAVVATHLDASGCLPQLRSLRLAATQLGDDGVDALIPSLLRYPSILHLDLARNDIGPRGAAQLAKLLTGGSVHDGPAEPSDSETTDSRMDLRAVDRVPAADGDAEEACAWERAAEVAPV